MLTRAAVHQDAYGLTGFVQELESEPPARRVSSVTALLEPPFIYFARNKESPPR